MADARAALKLWLKANNLSPYSAARKAGISPGTIYNFLSGTSDSLSSAVLQKLAAVTGNSVDNILTGTAPRSLIPVTHRIGTQGRMFDVDDARLSLARPPGLAGDDEFSAAIVDGDGLHPIPSDWAVFFRSQPTEAEKMIGQMAVVRFEGGGERPVIRTIRRGTKPGLYTLQAFNGAITEDVQIVAAHLIASFAKPAS